jgi:hypothetical protein
VTTTEINTNSFGEIDTAFDETNFDTNNYATSDNAFNITLI